MDLPQLKRKDLEIKNLHELLNSYAIWHGPTHTEQPHVGENCKILHDFIVQNFTEKPTVKLRKAYDAVDEMNLPGRVKDTLKQVKYCAFDIAQHLDSMNVSSMVMLKKIIEEKISAAESVTKNIE